MIWKCRTSYDIERLYRTSIHARSPRLARQGHIGPAGPSHARIAAAPRRRDRRANLSDDARYLPGQGGLALSRAPSTGAGRMDRRAVADAPERPPGQVLPSHASRPAASVGREGDVAPRRGRDEPGPRIVVGHAHSSQAAREAPRAAAAIAR